jgi:hypothetical protein
MSNNLQQLEQLRLRGLDLVQPEVEEELAQLLPRLTGLTSVCLASDAPGGGVVRRPLWSALCLLPRLARLACCGLDLGLGQPQGAPACRALAQLQLRRGARPAAGPGAPMPPSLAAVAPSLLACSVDDPCAPLGMLAGHPQLRSLSWQLHQHGPPDAAAALLGLARLETLALAGRELRGGVARVLPALCCQLRALDLSGIREPLPLAAVQQLLGRQHRGGLVEVALAASGSAWLQPILSFLLRRAVTLPLARARGRARLPQLVATPAELEAALQLLGRSMAGGLEYSRGGGGGGEVQERGEAAGEDAGGGCGRGAGRAFLLRGGGRELGRVQYEVVGGDEYGCSYSVRVVRV